MKLLSNSNPSEGTAITAGFQSKGRGQIGRSWCGDPFKNLYTSIILKPDHVPPAKQWIINQAISNAIHEVIQENIPSEVRIKWPNDIYIDDKKVCGILIQCTLSGKSIQNAIVGIGLNINQEHFPTEIPNPTSLFLELRKELDINQFRKRLYDSIQKWYLLTKEGETGKIEEYYTSYLYGINQSKAFLKDESVMIAMIVGVDEIGRLILSQDGVETAFNFNEVKMIINT